MTLKNSVLAGCALAAAAHIGSAQTIYTCRMNGVASYADRPCDGADPAVLKPVPRAQPGAEDAARLTRQRQAVEAIDQRHRKEEAAQQKLAQQAARRHAAHQKNYARLAMLRQWALEDAAAARDVAGTAKAAAGAARKSAAASVKAHRAGEKMALECPP